MIKSFKHKGLERFFYKGNVSGIQSAHAQRLQFILARLDIAQGASDMDLPGLRLHKLKGARQDLWSVKVSGNWRVTFRFDGVFAEIVNYEDYH